MFVSLSINSNCFIDTQKTNLNYIKQIHHKTIYYGYQYLDKSHNYIKNTITANIFFFIGLVSIGLINLCISQKNAINTFLSNKIFLHLGKISYGLYLYHWPIYLIFRKVIHSQFLLLIVCFLVTYIISFISYKLFETYFINLKDKYSY